MGNFQNYSYQLRIRGFRLVVRPTQECYLRSLSGENFDKMVVAMKNLRQGLNLPDNFCLVPDKNMERILFSGGEIFI